MFHSIRCLEQDWFCYELLYRLLFFINAKMRTTGEDHQFWKSRDVMTAPWKAIAFQEDCWRPYTIAWDEMNIEEAITKCANKRRTISPKISVKKFKPSSN